MAIVPNFYTTRPPVSHRFRTLQILTMLPYCLYSATRSSTNAHTHTRASLVCEARRLRVLATRSTASYYYYLLLNNVNGNAWLFTIPHNTCRLFPQSARVTRAQEVCGCERDGLSARKRRGSSARERDRARDR